MLLCFLSNTCSLQHKLKESERLEDTALVFGERGRGPPGVIPDKEADFLNPLTELVLSTTDPGAERLTLAMRPADKSFVFF